MYNMAEFKKRVYGCAIVKAINSNYNADFSGQPRTLPDESCMQQTKLSSILSKNI